MRTAPVQCAPGRFSSWAKFEPHRQASGSSAAFWLGMQQDHDLWHEQQALAGPELDQIEPMHHAA